MCTNFVNVIAYSPKTSQLICLLSAFLFDEEQWWIKNINIAYSPKASQLIRLLSAFLFDEEQWWISYEDVSTLKRNGCDNWRWLANGLPCLHQLAARNGEFRRWMENWLWGRRWSYKSATISREPLWTCGKLLETIKEGAMHPWDHSWIQFYGVPIVRFLDYFWKVEKLLILEELKNFWIIKDG